MASSGAGIRIDGLDSALRKVEGLSDAITNQRGMWQSVGAQVEQSIKRRFETGTGPGDKVWPKSLRALVQNGQTLVNTGLLSETITSNASDTGVEIGTNVLYAAIHQFGGTIHQGARRQKLQFLAHARTGKILKGFRTERQSNFMMMADVGAHDIRIPARPFLGIDDDDETAIAGAVYNWFTVRTGA